MKKMHKLSRFILALSSLALTAAFFLPVWFIFLIAPQYPEGLTMNIWLDKITGQVDIINGLNHYIGMKHIKAEMFPEFEYLRYIVIFYILFGLAVAITGKRKMLTAYLVLTVLGGIAAMFDFYKWGYDYGHNLDPKAAIQVPGLYYQPPLIGHKTLLNFDAYSYPDTGGWVIIVVSAIFFLVWFVEWRRYRKTKLVRTGLHKKIPAIAAIALFTLASCSRKPEPFRIGQDHCDACKMTIMDSRFGAEIITQKGRIYKFDDPHCVASFIKSGQIDRANILQTFFIDFENNKNFIEAEKTSFVVSPKLKSPMNSNAAAFSDLTRAEKIGAETGGSIQNWTELQHTIIEN